MVIMKKKDKLWEQVQKEFPCDPVLKEVHYARLKIHEQTIGMSDKEFVEFIKLKAKNQIETNSLQLQ